jgi:hypothetical protein
LKKSLIIKKFDYSKNVISVTKDAPLTLHFYNPQLRPPDKEPLEHSTNLNSSRCTIQLSKSVNNFVPLSNSRLSPKYASRRRASENSKPNC